jgi:hypothetical protein
MAKKSGFLKGLGTFVDIQVKVAGHSCLAAWDGIKWIARKSPGAVKKGTSAVKKGNKAIKKRQEANKEKKAKPKGKAKYSSLKGAGSFEEKLHENSLIITIAGKRGSGKSTLGFRLMENIHAKTSRPCYVVGVGDKFLPGWIDSVENIDEVGNGGVVLVDEGALTFSSRDSMSKSNKELGKLMAVARHKDMTLLLITQNTGMIDKNVLNLTDTVILKQGSLLQSKMERDVMKSLYTEAQKKFTKIAAKDRVKYSYLFDDEQKGIIETSLPSFWSSKISKNKA